jgi:predicted kinase
VTPTVFLVIGPAGCGKSTLSRAIARRYGAALLDKDTVANRFTGLLLAQHGSAPDARDDDEFYLSTILPLEYETLLALAGDNLAVGRSVVLDAPFGRFVGDPDFLTQARAQHGWPDAEVVVVQVRASGPVVRTRLATRGYERDSWKLAHWDEFWAGASTGGCRWTGVTHVELPNDGVEVDVTPLDVVARTSELQPGGC